MKCSTGRYWLSLNWWTDWFLWLSFETNWLEWKDNKGFMHVASWEQGFYWVYFGPFIFQLTTDKAYEEE